MRVENINSLNFSARFVNRDIVANTIKDISICKPNISCVEIDSKNLEDINALYRVTCDWQYDTFSINIYNNIIRKLNGNDLYKEYKTFAITRQEELSNPLNSKEILALAEIKEIIPHNYAHLTHIQVDPEYYNKGIGTSMINVLKRLYSHITLSSTNNHRTKEFYRMNDFIEESVHSGHFKWSKDIFSILGINKE